MEKDLLKEAILLAIKCLTRADDELFELPIEDDEHTPETARVLHEVCINHKLAEYLSATILPLLDTHKMFVDIEFNREGTNIKKARIAGKEKRVRPDIIIHNRKSGSIKFNFLVVECKKKTADTKEKEKDCEKIEGLMNDSRLAYRFGLQVLYGAPPEATLFYNDEKDGKIKREPIEID